LSAKNINLKITISLEIKGDEKSISFKMFYRQNEAEIWKQGQKVKIYPDEIPAIMDCLKMVIKK
jgi:hypothetical protein